MLPVPLTLRNDIVHAAAGIDQRRGDDGKRAALFDVARSGEKTPRALQGVSIDTAREHFAGGRRNGVVGASQTRDRIEQHDNIALVFYQRFAFSKTISATWMWRCRRFVKGRADDFAFTVRCMSVTSSGRSSISNTIKATSG